MCEKSEKSENLYAVKRYNLTKVRRGVAMRASLYCDDIHIADAYDDGDGSATVVRFIRHDDKEGDSEKLKHYLIMEAYTGSFSGTERVGNFIDHLGMSTFHNVDMTQKEN